MQGKFKYFYVKTAADELDIDDIGKCAIQANNDNGEFVYLIIDTDLGITKVLEYGPINPELSILCKNTSCRFTRFEYSESKISKIIDNFLNQPLKITQARVISAEEAFNNCINIVDYVKEGKY